MLTRFVETHCPPLAVHHLTHLRVTITSRASLHWWTCALTEGAEQSALTSVDIVVAIPDDMEEWGALLSQEKFASMRCVKVIGNLRPLA